MDFLPNGGAQRTQHPLKGIKWGDDFLESLQTAGIVRNRGLARRVYLLAVMAATGRISGVNGADLHAVRVSAAANAKQVERADGAKLWRCKVSQSGAGYRLHYWSIPGGGVELDRVLIESHV